MYLDENRQYLMTAKDDLLAVVEQQHIKFISLWFTDIVGLVKNITIPASQLENVIDNGIHFDGSSIEGLARVAESDMMLMPDLSTYVLLPWTSNGDRTARLMCNIHTPNGQPFIGDPRNALQRVLDKAKDMGFAFKTGMELEFFLFRLDGEGKPVIHSPHDTAGYFDVADDSAQRIRHRMMETLSEMGIMVDSTHSETGHGQHEIDFQYNHALVSADQILTARIAMKYVAQQNDLHLTFMPRPNADMPGSGMHTHQSLHDLNTDDNVFADTSHEYGLSETAKYFLAGQLAHARGMSAILSPLVNSYKRLGTSFEAPIYLTWAHVNRGALIRIPSTAPGKESHTRLELRCPDPSSNPYLATAVMLMAGLDGIKHKLPLPEPWEETLLTNNRARLRQVGMLPVSLGEALDELSQDDIVLEALGPYISDRYIAAKRQEFNEYNRQITSWEIDRYLSRF